MLFTTDLVTPGNTMANDDALLMLLKLVVERSVLAYDLRYEGGSWAAGIPVKLAPLNKAAGIEPIIEESVVLDNMVAIREELPDAAIVPAMKPFLNGFMFDKSIEPTKPARVPGGVLPMHCKGTPLAIPAMPAKL